jgi:hypothetical protein
MIRVLYLLLLGITANAQITPPLAGYVVDREGALRPVHGLAGAFTLGNSIEHGVISADYSGKSLVVKTEGELIIDGERYGAPTGRARAAFDAHGRVSIIFFPDTGNLWTWRNGEFTDHISVEPDAPAVVRDGELFIDGTPIRLASRALHVSRMGEDWLVVYAEDGLFAVRSGNVYELPEAEN